MHHHDLLHSRQKLRKQHTPHNGLRTTPSAPNHPSLCPAGADFETEHLLNVDARVHAGYDEAFAEDRLGNDVVACGASGDVVCVVGEEGCAAHFERLGLELLVLGLRKWYLC